MQQESALWQFCRRHLAVIKTTVYQVQSSLSYLRRRLRLFNLVIVDCGEKGCEFCKYFSVL